jgi:RND family efflux transporter MFP subunit
MSKPEHDLSRLAIDRDAPAGAPRRALRFNIALAVAATVVIVAVVWWLRGLSGGSEVTTARAEVVGTGSGSGPSITANGYVVARTKASVSSKIPGRLEYLGVSEGSVVTEGEVIARLENQDYRAAVSEARARLASSRAALREAVAQRDQLRRDSARVAPLSGQDFVSQQEAEDVYTALAAAEARVGVQAAQVQVAEAALGVAEANLENTLIRAPFDGTVLRKDAEVGEVVAPSVGGGLTRGAVVTMADLNSLEVEVDVNEAYIAQIRNGQPASIILDAYPDTSYLGEVRQIVPTADRQKATVLVKVSILEPDARILPEMGARVDFLPESALEGVEARSRVFVPAAAVYDQAGEAVVWIVREGRAYRTPVDAGPVSGGRREIRTGLSGGEQVVTGGAEGLNDGARVQARR